MATLYLAPKQDSVRVDKDAAAPQLSCGVRRDARQRLERERVDNLAVGRRARVRRRKHVSREGAMQGAPCDDDAGRTVHSLGVSRTVYVNRCG